MRTPFDIDKAAQAAHYLISKGGGEMEILKLVKLLYLADRHSLQTRRTPLIGGSYFALKHGPITSEVLDLINDGTPGEDSPWELLISDRANHRVAIETKEIEYDALSSSDLRILEQVWSEFGHRSKWELVDWTHRHCEEWSEPTNGRGEISARRLAEAFAWEPSEIEDFVTEQAARHRLQSLIS